MSPTIAHLFEVPQHRATVAELIHEEFWLTVPGASADSMQARLAQADADSGIPLCLVALQGDEPIGAVNLVHSDDDRHPEWTPWLAGMVVARGWRGRGVGSALVRALLEEARRLSIQSMYFGTGGPHFYRRLGAVHHEQPQPGFWYMRFDL